MSFIRRIKKKSGVYLAEVESYRDGKRVRQRLIRYLGKEGSLQAGVTTPPVAAQKGSLQPRVTTPLLTTDDIPAAAYATLQRRAVDNGMTLQDFLLVKLEIKPDGRIPSHHGVDRKTGKKY